MIEKHHSFTQVSTINLQSRLHNWWLESTIPSPKYQLLIFKTAENTKSESEDQLTNAVGTSIPLKFTVPEHLLFFEMSFLSASIWISIKIPIHMYTELLLKFLYASLCSGSHMFTHICEGYLAYSFVSVIISSARSWHPDGWIWVRTVINICEEKIQPSKHSSSKMIP